MFISAKHHEGIEELHDRLILEVGHLQPPEAAEECFGDPDMKKMMRKIGTNNLFPMQDGKDSQGFAKPNSESPPPPPPKEFVTMGARPEAMLSWPGDGSEAAPPAEDGADDECTIGAKDEETGEKDEESGEEEDVEELPRPFEGRNLEDLSQVEMAAYRQWELANRDPLSRQPHDVR